MSSGQKEIIYRPVGFDDFPPLKTASVADFIFTSPHAQLDDSAAFIDAESGLTISRNGLYDLCLRLAKGVDTLGLRRGNAVAMIFRYGTCVRLVKDAVRTKLILYPAQTLLLGLLSFSACFRMAYVRHWPIRHTLFPNWHTKLGTVALNLYSFTQRYSPYSYRPSNRSI